MTASELYERAKYFFPPPPSPALSCDRLDLLPNRCGVYFFWENEVVIYVGESVDLKSRLSGHEHKSDSRLVSFIECDKSQRRRLESFYIGVLDPVLNSQSTTRCQVIYRATKRRSLPRKFYAYIKANPGCSLTQLRKAGGWKHSAERSRWVIERMAEWGFITEVCSRTAGRSKRTYYEAGAI